MGAFLGGLRVVATPRCAGKVIRLIRTTGSELAFQNNRNLAIAEPATPRAFLRISRRQESAEAVAKGSGLNSILGISVSGLSAGLIRNGAPQYNRRVLKQTFS